MRIKQIAETGRSVIVEYQRDGQTERVILPQDVITDGKVDDDVLAVGIPYGVPWETATTPAIAAELRRVGIWTGRDLAERPQVASAAIQRVMGMTLAALRRAATEYEGGQR